MKFTSVKISFVMRMSYSSVFEGAKLKKKLLLKINGILPLVKFQNKES